MSKQVLLFPEDDFGGYASKSEMRRVTRLRTPKVIEHPTLTPGTYTLSMHSDLRAYVASITVEVLRVYDNNTVDVRVVKSTHLPKGTESNVSLSGKGWKRVFTRLENVT